MEQDIKILEDYIELIKKGYCEDCNELCNIYGTPTYPANKISEATEHLIKAYKELEEKLNETLNANLALVHGNANSIPVSLVEEKIERYKELQLEYINKYDEDSDTINGMINVMKELLEERS